MIYTYLIENYYNTQTFEFCLSRSGIMLAALLKISYIVDLYFYNHDCSISWTVCDLSLNKFQNECLLIYLATRFCLTFIRAFMTNTVCIIIYHIFGLVAINEIDIENSVKQNKNVHGCRLVFYFVASL